MNRVRSFAKVLVLAVSFLCWLWACYSSTDHNRATPTSGTLTPTVLDSAGIQLAADPANCGRCHQNQYRDWEHSHHALALRKPEDSLFLRLPYTVRLSGNRRYVLYKTGDRFRVSTDDYFQKNSDFEIKYVIGVDPLLQYIVELPGGLHQCLTFALDTRKREYFDLKYDTSAPPGDWLHWTGRSMTWNTACADCHSTQVRKNYDPATDTYQTTFRHIRITCEGCHGTVKQLPLNETDCWLPAGERIDNKSQSGEISNCATCHSRRMQLLDGRPEKTSFHDVYTLEAAGDHMLFEDGQIKDEVFEYHSFTQSKMFANGVKCTNCHNVHSGKLLATGNQLCASCHQPNMFDTPEHHFHLAGSKGAQCVNCHMPGKNYMQRHFRRDHSLRVPRPDLTVKFGTPNACNSCHQDKSPQWTASAVENWYGPVRKVHFSDMILHADPANPQSVDRLVDYIHHLENKTTPRMLAINKFRKITSDQDFLTRLAPLETDPAPEIRSQYLASVYDKSLVSGQLTKALLDPGRTVRIQAFRSLISIPAPPPAGAVSAEYTAMARLNADNAGVLIEFANYHYRMGQAREAIRLYRQAMKIDDKLPELYGNLAQIFNALNQNDSAQIILDAGIQKIPGRAELHFYKGMLYGESGETESAIIHFVKAAEMEPFNGQYAYNAGVMHIRQKNWKFAEKYLRMALQADPGNTRYSEAMAYLKQERDK